MLAELFRFQDRFIGCLALRRVPRLRASDIVAGGHRATESDVSSTAFLAKQLLHQTSLDLRCDVELTIHAYSYESLHVCPALETDGKCGLHQQGKPTSCQCVPFDALLPNEMQRWVLAERASEASAWGASCIATHPITQTSPVVTRLSVVNEHVQTLEKRRKHLVIERELWGNFVFSQLETAWSHDPARLWAVPSSGYLLMSLVPMLTHLARHSPASHARVLRFLGAQEELMKASIQLALSRKNSADRQETQLLRSLLEKNQMLHSRLKNSSVIAHKANDAAALEQPAELSLTGAVALVL